MWCTLCMCLYENKSLMTSVDHRKHLYHFTWLWLNCSIYMNSFYNAKVWLSGLSVEKHKLLRLHQIYRCFKYQNHKVEWVWKDMSLSKSQILNFWVNCPFKMSDLHIIGHFIFATKSFRFMQSNLQMRNTEKQKQFIFKRNYPIHKRSKLVQRCRDCLKTESSSGELCDAAQGH